jgi:hypothetical protein
MSGSGSGSESGSSTKTLGSAPEPFDGKGHQAEAFWSNLENYFYLNDGMYPSGDKKVSAALTYFKMGTPAGEWARDRVQAALGQSPPTFGTWAQFKDDFKEHFIPAESQLEATNKMYTFKMGNKEFNEWYQEWSNYANKAGVDANTKMFAFRNAIPDALHFKIIGIKPQPNTMKDLVEAAREFDRFWRLYKSPAYTKQRGFSSRAITEDRKEELPINLYTGNTPPPTPRYGETLSKEEKDRRFKENRCFYCGKKNHRAKDCNAKKAARNNRGQYQNFRKDTKARAVTAQDQDSAGEDPSPSYEDPTTVSRFYHSNNRFDIIRPKSAPVQEDF